MKNEPFDYEFLNDSSPSIQEENKKKNEESNTKTILTKSGQTIQVTINEELQINNTLVERGIYLVEAEEGVIWGYNAEIYEFNDQNIIKRKEPAQQKTKNLNPSHQLDSSDY